MIAWSRWAGGVYIVVVVVRSKGLLLPSSTLASLASSVYNTTASQQKNQLFPTASHPKHTMADPAKPSILYRVTNVAFDLVTLGVFTGRYKKPSWPNAWAPSTQN